MSASIDNEEYFQLMITNAWNLNNKQYSKAVRLEYWSEKKKTAGDSQASDEVTVDNQDLKMLK